MFFITIVGSIIQVEGQNEGGQKEDRGLVAISLGAAGGSDSL